MPDVFLQRLDWRWYAVAGATLLLGALVSLVLAVSARHEQLLEVLREQGVFVMSRASVLDGALGDQILVPRAFDFSTARQLLEAEGEQVVFGPVRRSAVHVATGEGEVLRVALLDVPKQLSAFLTGEASCNPRVAYWAGPGPMPAEVRRESSITLVRPAPQDAVILELAAAESLPAMVQCSGGDWFDASEIAVVPKTPDAGGAYARVSAAVSEISSLDDAFGTSTIAVEALSERVSEDLQRRFGWLDSLLLIAALLQLGVLLAFGVLLAATRSSDIQIYRSLGAPLRFICYRFCFVAFTALLPALAMTIAVAGWMWFSLGAKFAASALVYALAIYAGGALAFLAGFFTVGLWKLDSRLALRTSATQSPWSVKLAGAALTAVVALLGPFAAFAWLASAQLDALEALDLGYDASELWVLRAAPAGGAQTSGSAAHSVSERLGRDGARAVMLCSEPWLDAASQLPRGVRGRALFASANVAAVLGLEIEGRDFALGDMGGARVSLVQTAFPAELRSAQLIATPIGYFSGLRFGASSPQLAFAMILPLSEGSCTSAPAVVFRASDAPTARGRAAEIATTLREYRLSFPLKVSDIIEAQRRGLTMLRDSAVAALAVGLVLLGVACVMIAGAYARFARRVTAIRLSLGETPTASALHLSGQSAGWIASGVVLGILASALMNYSMQGAMTGAESLTGVETFAVTLAVGVTAFSGIFLSCMWVVRRLPIAQLLRED